MSAAMLLAPHQSAESPSSPAEGFPNPWGNFFGNPQPSDNHHHNSVASSSRLDLDQQTSQKFRDERWDSSSASPLDFPQTEDPSLSPAAMFLSAFSPPIQPTRLPDDEGEIVAGYILGPVIGCGGFSTIRRASSPSGGVVAIKSVRRSDIEQQSDPSVARKRLDHETEIWSSLSHEHILPLFSVDHTLYADFFVTLLCPAGSLFDILKRDGTPALPHDDAGMMFRQVVRGVRYLHEVAGYVHRDIKLENVLVDEMGVCRISDFGLARKIGELDEDERLDEKDNSILLRHRSTIHHTWGRQAKPSLPSHGSILRHAPRRHRTSTPVGDHTPAPVHPAHAFQPGSLPYAAPELLSPQTGKHQGPNPAQDMWALGCVLYALLTGRLPFCDPFEPRLTMKILHGVYEMPCNVGRGADRVLRGCLEHDVNDRWTIAMVDEIAWDIGWGEVEDSSAVSHADEFEFVDCPNHPSTSTRSKSRSRSRACHRKHDSMFDPTSTSRSRRSLSRVSVTTASSLSTRSTSRSVSRNPPRRPFGSECGEFASSVLNDATVLSFPAPLDIGSSALLSPRSFVERGRSLMKTDTRLTTRFAPSIGASTARSDFGRESNHGGELFVGTDALDSTARWASALGLNTIAEVTPRVSGGRSPAADKLRAIQQRMDPQSSKRAESTPPAPSAWPRRSRARVKEEPPSLGSGETTTVGGTFLREPSATPIPIVRKNGTRSRSVGYTLDSTALRHF